MNVFEDHYGLELKNLFVVPAVSLFFFFLIGAFASPSIISMVESDFANPNINLIFSSPFEVFTLQLFTALIFALAFTLPVLLLQFKAFITSALNEKEAKALNLTIPVSLVLFVLGAVIAYKLVLVQGITFLASIAGFPILWNAYAMVSSIVFFSFVAGLAFQLPLILKFLSHAGIVNKEMLLSKRKHAWLGLTVFSAVLTPTGDALTMVLFALPLIVLFELSIKTIKEE